MKNARKRRPKLAEDLLDSLKSITLTLDNGEVVKLSVQRETRIPDDPAAFVRAVKRGPAKVAFWNAQTERALSRVRRQEREVSRVEGHTYQVFRTYYTQEGLDVTEAMLRSAVDQDPKVRKARIGLEARRREYGALRAVRDAVDVRNWMMQALLKKSDSY